jgi:hypothetical protein
VSCASCAIVRAERPSVLRTNQNPSGGTHHKEIPVTRPKALQVVTPALYRSYWFYSLKWLDQRAGWDSGSVRDFRSKFSSFLGLVHFWWFSVHRWCPAPVQPGEGGWGDTMDHKSNGMNRLDHPCWCCLCVDSLEHANYVVINLTLSGGRANTGSAYTTTDIDQPELGSRSSASGAYVSGGHSIEHLYATAMNRWIKSSGLYGWRFCDRSAEAFLIRYPLYHRHI